MEQKLSIITINGVRRRIKNELEKLLKGNICIEDDIKIDKYNDIGYSIEFTNLKDNNYYKFIISNYYPFNAPKLYINEKPILFYHEIKNLEFNKLLKKYTGIECFCCQTILCGNNWAPSFTFIHILNDINRYKDARHEIVVRIIVDVIKRKYLIDDTNIIEWLY